MESKTACYKVVLIGEVDVGKSSIFIRFRDGRFVDSIRSTVGLDYTTKAIEYKRKNGTKGSVEIQLWDTAGLERTGFMTNNYYVHSRAVILMYDVTDMSSLNRLQGWYDDAKQYCPKDQAGSLTKYFLLGNKIDCSSGEIEVNELQGLSFAERIICIPKEHVFQVSVKTGKGLDVFLNNVAAILAETKAPVKENITIVDDESKNKECSC